MDGNPDTTMAERLVELQKQLDTVTVERDALDAKVKEHEQTIADKAEEVTRLKVLIADNIAFEGKPDDKVKSAMPETWSFNDKYAQLMNDMKKD